MNYIGGKWLAGSGKEFSSLNPVDGASLWQGSSSSKQDVKLAVSAAKQAFKQWRLLSFDKRLSYIEKFKSLLEENREYIAEAIAKETGKILWDAEGEAGAMIGKLDLSVKSFNERTGNKSEDKGGFTQELRHMPHGVMAVFGPYNFPAHLPNGHIIPSLLAGNTVVFKPSEETPLVAAIIVKLWEQSGLPKGVVNLVQGSKDTGIALTSSDGLAGILFTGSYATGKILHKQLAGKPEIMLALELGGNNPLVVWDAENSKAAADLIIQSAYIGSGQRCTCARRLIIPNGKNGDKILDALIDRINDIRIGGQFDSPEPFMGALINKQAADNVLNMQNKLVKAGGKILVEAKRLENGETFISPALIDVTNAKNRGDDECFGALLQVIRVGNFSEAIAEANNTKYGLSAGLLSDSGDLWNEFKANIRAGIVNWNKPLTGASGSAPFGGIGHSGNLRPAAYYAADYCAYPMASIISDELKSAEAIKGLD